MLSNSWGLFPRHEKGISERERVKKKPEALFIYPLKSGDQEIILNSRSYYSNYNNSIRIDW